MAYGESFGAEIPTRIVAAIDDLEDWLLTLSPFPTAEFLKEILIILQEVYSHAIGDDNGNSCVDAMRTGLETFETKIKLLKLSIDQNASFSEKVTAMGNKWLSDVVRDVLDKIGPKLKDGGKEMIEIELLLSNIRKKVNGEPCGGMKFPNLAKNILENICNVFKSDGSFDVLRSHLLDGPNRELYEKKLKRIMEICPLEFNAQENDPNSKVSIIYELVMPLAMAIFEAQERKSLANNIGAGTGTVENLVNIDEITIDELFDEITSSARVEPVAKVPEGVVIGSDGESAAVVSPRVLDTASDSDIIDGIAADRSEWTFDFQIAKSEKERMIEDEGRNMKLELRKTLYGAIEESIRLVRSKINKDESSMSREDLQKLSKLLTELNAVKTNPSSTPFGLMKEIISLYKNAILDLDSDSMPNFSKLSGADVKRNIQLSVFRSKVDGFMAQSTI
jgi:hypothetical protein